MIFFRVFQQIPLPGFQFVTLINGFYFSDYATQGKNDLVAVDNTEHDDAGEVGNSESEESHGEESSHSDMDSEEERKR